MEAKSKNYKIIMTEKDYYKFKNPTLFNDYFDISNFDLNNLHYLKISLIIEEKEKILKKIMNLHETN